MHAVIWSIQDRRYATAAARIVEVVPLVESRPMDAVDDWVRGLMNYRGKLVPLIDVGVLLGGAPREPRRADRILVVRVDDTDDRVLGLLVEHLLGVETVELEGDAAHPGLETPGAAYLGPVAIAGGDTVQLVEPDRLLDDEQADVLFGRVGSVDP